MIEKPYTLSATEGEQCPAEPSVDSEAIDLAHNGQRAPDKESRSEPTVS